MKAKNVFGWLLLCWVIFGFFSPGADSTYLQKKFVVGHDRGKDVLCDEYVVKENDSVLKVFREKGEISSTDLSWFLEMFTRLNPQVKDINKIYIGQRILVPLKIIPPNSLEGQETGVVNIPMITITNIPLKIQGKSTQYIVAEGDCISKLLARQFGDYHSRSYKESLEIFKFLNPDIKEPDKIHVGQKINLPAPTIKEEAWYPELFDESGKLVITEAAAAKAEIAAPAKPPEKPEPLEMPEPMEIAELPTLSDLPELLEPQKDSQLHGIPEAPLQAPKTELGAPFMAGKKELPPLPQQAPPSVTAIERPSYSALTLFKKVARIFEVDLLDSGEYFFPRQGLDDLKLDLSETPVVELKSGEKILLVQGKEIPTSDQNVIQSFWKNMSIMNIPENAGLRDMLTLLCPIIHKQACENQISFEDQGVSVAVRGEYIFNNLNGLGKTCLTLIDIQDQKTPNTIGAYLASKEISLSEWMDSTTYFGPVNFNAIPDMPAQTTTSVSGEFPEEFVRQMAAVLGFKYQEKYKISFQYAGFKVDTTTNLLSAGPGKQALVDFGDLHGDALQSAETTGFKVIQINLHQDALESMKALLQGMSVSYKENTVFWTADRTKVYNISVQAPGLLVDTSGDPAYQSTLVTPVLLHEYLLSFFNQSGIRVVHLIQ